MRPKLRQPLFFRTCPGRFSVSGTVLLEVILALGLFMGAALAIGTGLSRGTAEVERLRSKAHAVDLAVSILSELQIGIRPVAPAGPEPCAPPFEDWTSQVEIEPQQTSAMDVTDSPLLLARITVRHQDPDIVHRLAQFIPANTQVPIQSAEGTASPFSAPTPVPANPGVE